MLKLLNRKYLSASLAAVALLAGTAVKADTVDPATFSADLAVGESVTINKTVTISEGGPTDALIDVHFLIDTSGSMGSQVNAAKAAASDLFTGLNDTFGDVQAGVGVFSEGASLTDPDIRGRAVIGGLTSDATTFTNNVNLVTLGNPDNGGDFPESGYTAIALAGGALDWRPGSSRFMFVFTDATGKGDLAGAAAALAADDITLVALAYGSSGPSYAQSTYGNQLGATVYAATTSAAGIIADVTAGITGGFADYSEVTLSDFDAGLPHIDVSVVCTGAAGGVCDGAVAKGDYDRSVERSFTFDVTFKRLAAGDAAFDTLALVDGGIVAREADRFSDGVAPVPVPAGLPLLLTALGGFGLLARRRRGA